MNVSTDSPGNTVINFPTVVFNSTSRERVNVMFVRNAKYGIIHSATQNVIKYTHIEIM